MTPTEPLYLTVAEVAALLRVSVPSVYRWIEKDASFPALKIHGVVRVNRARLMVWLRDREQGRRAHAHPMGSQVHGSTVTGTSGGQGAGCAEP